MKDYRKGITSYFEDETGESVLIEKIKLYEDFDFNDVTEIELIDGRKFKLIVKDREKIEVRENQWENARAGKSIYESIKRDNPNT